MENNERYRKFVKPSDEFDKKTNIFLFESYEELKYRIGARKLRAVTVSSKASKNP